MSDQPPPPPPHGTNPRRTSPNLPPGKYDIFIIPPHSSGAGFLYLPSLRPNVNSFAAGFASALVLVVLFQSMAPAFKVWYSNFQGMGNMGMLLLVIAVGVGAWALGRIQNEGGPSAGNRGDSRHSWGYYPGGNGPSGGPYSNSGPPPHSSGPDPDGPPPPPPPHGSPPPRSGSSQNTAGSDKPKSSWQERPQERSQERPRERPQERPKERPQERPRERSPERSPERSQERSQERPREHPEERPQERPQPRPQERPKERPEERPQAESTKGSWERAREETRRKEEERKAKEAEQRKKDEIARRIKELRAKEARERAKREQEAKERREKEAREKEEREREIRERLEQEARIREEREREIREKIEKEVRIREVREREAREKLEKEAREARERQERELQEAREKLEREAREKEQQAKEQREREQQEKARKEKELREKRLQEARERELRERLEREKTLRERLEREVKEREAREREVREREAKERENKEREAKEREAARQKEAEAAAAKAAEEVKAKAKETETTRRGTYAFSSVGERTNPWPNGKPPTPAPSTTKSTVTPSVAPTATPSAASSSARRPPPPTAQSFRGTDDDAYSYRPYDQPKSHTRRRSGETIFTESSYAPSQSTSRTTPPPSMRGPYTTKDPDKIVIKAVYGFLNQFSKTPASQLLSGVGHVTDGLILRITTEGLFIDDDVRGVPQREWDVKAWTLKLMEVWCPAHTTADSNASPRVTNKSAPPRFKFSARGQSKMLMGDDADAYLTELLHACKDDCRMGPHGGSDAASFRGTSQAGGEWKHRGLHVLRATIRDQEGKRFLFVLGEEEGWKVAVGLQRLRKGTQVRQLGVQPMPLTEVRNAVETLGW
ncbi:hypothetical protein F5Y09DRAFT_18226 [Xylaria sp. FL1042]|nr:hypothetical protein F5Y09DRAFT_18226 [Xylaria sp. FL1042]